LTYLPAYAGRISLLEELFMKKSERNWMAGIGILVIIASAFVFAACGDLADLVNGDDKDDKSKPPADNGID
jgi:hypothetical protein